MFEFVDKNLLEVIRELYPSGFGAALVRSTIWQLVRAIEYCHRHDVVHRDIKPENLLVSLSDKAVKLCDFGFARTLPIGTKRSPLTDYVATRWYRAPELLVGSRVYGPAVDMFAIGCIMGEITDGNPLMPGESELDQMSLMQHVIGPLLFDQLETFSVNPRFVGTCIPKKPAIGKSAISLHQRYLGKLPRRGLAIMNSFLEIDPRLRMTADSAIRHSYFDGIGLYATEPVRPVSFYRSLGLPPRLDTESMENKVPHSINHFRIMHMHEKR